MLTPSEAEKLQLTIDEIEMGQLREFQYLFVLAGKLRGLEIGLHQTDRRAARKYMHVAHELAEHVSKMGLGKQLDWKDPDAVALEFEKAWSARRLPESTTIFETAVKLSETNFLELPASMNKWVVRIANLAFCLGEMLPDTPILIPVSQKTADMLGTSLRTLSLALQEAVRERIVLVVEKADQSLPSRRARRLKFNRSNRLISNDFARYRKSLNQALAQIEP